MKRLYVLVTCFLVTASFSTMVQAKNLVRVKAIGSSPKGQYVAFEEFGYKNGRKTAFSKIRVMNMWKNKMMSSPVQVIGNSQKNKLQDIRIEAKGKASLQFKKYNIAI
jgi:predicted secreted protein